jgi:hypothetical protein
MDSPSNDADTDDDPGYDIGLGLAVYMASILVP